MIRIDTPSPLARSDREATFAPALPWVRYHADRIALRLPASGDYDADDLFQVGALAAWDLTATWDESGSLFTTYAWRRVVGVMIDLVRGAAAKGFAQAGIRGKLERGEPIRVDSFSRVVGHDESHEPIRFEDTIGECDEDHGDGAEAEFAALLRRIEADALEQERAMVLGHFVRGETMKKVGQGMGLSESRVSQVIGGVVDRVRERCAARGLTRRTAFA